jgi:S-DNA-T family DNA segregation ATPase FtsK/SpoIIIE
MNLEDLILETQISELKKLQIRCVEARSAVLKIRAQLLELDSQSSEAIARLQSRLEAETKQHIELLTVEVRNRLEQTDVDIAGQRESASEARERRLEALHAKLKQDVAERRQKLQNELWVLQSVYDESNEDTPVRNAERAQESFNTQRAFIDQQLADLNSRVDHTARYLDDCHAGMEKQLPPPVVELKGRDASRQIAVEQLDYAIAAAGRVDGQMLPQWIAGWRLFGLGLLIFIVVTIASTALRADLTKFVNPELSKPDWEWLGVSAVIGVGAAVLINTVLTLLARSGLRGAFEDVLRHTSNATAAASHWAQKSQQEIQQLMTAADKWKAEMVERREKHSVKLQNATDEKINELIQSYTEQVARQSRLFDEQMLNGESETTRHQTAVENWRSQELARIHSQHEAELAQGREAIEKEFSARRAQLTTDEANAMARWRAGVLVASELARISNERAKDICSWESLKSNGWTSPTALLTTLPVGDLEVMLPAPPEHAEGSLDADTVFELPGLLNFPRDASILVEHDAAGREPALEFVRAILLRLLTHIAPGRVQFTLIDPVGLGQSFSALMHLSDFDELLINNRIWTDATQIRDQLQKITEHMESVFQTYLRSEFETIEQYNAAAGEVAEPYHFVVVAGFPHSFTEEAARALTSILTSGPRCGVHAIVTWSPDQTVPRSFDVNNLRNCCTQFHVTKGLVQPGMSPSSRPVEKVKTLASQDILDAKPVAPAAAEPADNFLEFSALAPPESAEYVSLVRAVGEQSRNARRVEVSFSRIAPKSDAIWTSRSADGIDFPIGRAGAARLQFMRLGRGTSQHVLVAGKTGSGKSTLLHILITNLSLHYSPDEVQFYLIDFKKGVEFRTYAANKLPHARVVAIESDREFGLSVLERLDEVLQERGELFRVRGVQDLPSFRKQFPNEKMPRLLLLIDEFQEFFTSEDRVSSKAALLMDRLIRQGRAFGIHVLLGSQTLGGAYSLARSTLGQVAVRIALQCSESDAHLILSEENGAARQLTRPGEAIYNDANGMVEGNHPFQIAWLDEEKRESMIHEMTQRPDYADKAPGRMIVFEGNVAPTIDECEPLNAWINNRAGSTRTSTDGMPAWIGDPVAISEPMCIRFQRSGGQNALIVGQEGDLADSILASTILSICSGPAGSGGSSSSRLVLLHDGQDLASQENFSTTFTKRIAPRFSLRKASEADAVVAELAAELAGREAAGVGPNSPAIILAVRNIGQFRSLRRDEDDFGMSGFGAAKSSTPASQLGDLIRKGPLVGIHVIVWSDTFSNAMRWLSNSLLREFDSRIAFRLNQTDSSSLIDTPAAASLSPGRAILYRDQTGTADRFRPFSWPSQQWLATVPVAADEEIVPAAELIEQTSAVVTEAAKPAISETVPVEVLAPITESVAVAETGAIAEAAPPAAAIEPAAIEPAAIEPAAIEPAANEVAVSEPLIGQPAVVEVLPEVVTIVAAETAAAQAELPVPEVPVSEGDASPAAAVVSEAPAVVEAVQEVVIEAASAAETIAATAQSVVESTTSEVKSPDVTVTNVAAIPVAVDAQPPHSKVQPLLIAEPTAKVVAPADAAPAETVTEKSQPPAKRSSSKSEARKPDVSEKSGAKEKPVVAKTPLAPPAKTPAKQKQTGKPAATPVAESPKPQASKPAPAPVQPAKPQAPAAVNPVSKPPVAPPAKSPEPVAASADDDMDFVLDDSIFAKAVPHVAPTPTPSAPKPTAPVPATPAASASAPPETTPKKVGKPTAMAVRLSSRRTDHNRLLDAPPEPKAPTEPRLAPHQEEPSSDFDEMDFNSLMIE